MYKHIHQIITIITANISEVLPMCKAWCEILLMDELTVISTVTFRVVAILISFCKGDRGTEILEKSPKVTELLQGRPGFSPWWSGS